MENENLINLNNLQVKLVWALIEPNLIRNSEYYDKRIETSRLNGFKGGRPKKGEEKPNNNLNKPNETQAETKKPNETLSDSDTGSDTGSDTDTDVLLKKETKGVFESKKFKKPSLEEVRAYCQERKNNVDPETWLDHYTANGWKVGKNQMKDWQATVRTWEKNNFSSPTTAKKTGLGLEVPSTYGEQERQILEAQRKAFANIVYDEETF